MRALIVGEEGDRAVAQPQREALTAAAAAGLCERGVRPGDRVLVRLPKSLQWLVAMRAL